MRSRELNRLREDPADLAAALRGLYKASLFRVQLFSRNALPEKLSEEESLHGFHTLSFRSEHFDDLADFSRKLRTLQRGHLSRRAESARNAQSQRLERTALARVAAALVFLRNERVTPGLKARMGRVAISQEELAARLKGRLPVFYGNENSIGTLLETLHRQGKLAFSHETEGSSNILIGPVHEARLRKLH